MITWEASDEEVTADRVSQVAAVELGQVLVLDAQAHLVAADLDAHVTPRVAAQDGRGELGPAAVRLTVNEQGRLQLFFFLPSL
jgi:hypothetical protein